MKALFKHFFVVLACIFLFNVPALDAGNRIVSSDPGGNRLKFKSLLKRQDTNLSIRMTDKAGDITDIIRTDSPGRLKATLTDAQGNPLPDQVVTFSTTLGKFYPAKGTGLTNSNGVATVILLADDSDQGDGVATSEFGGYSASMNFAANPGKESGLSVRLLEDATGYKTSVITAQSPGRVQALLTNAGVPLCNRIVTFSTTLGTFYPAEGTALTNSKGMASVLLSAGSGRGKGRVTVKSGESSAELDFNAVGNEGMNLLLKLLDEAEGETVNSIGPDSPGRLEATLVYESGTPVSTRMITFTVDPESGRFDPGTGTALTNENGLASVLLSAGEKSGAAKVTATYDKYSASLDFANTGDASGEISISLVLLSSETGEATGTVSAESPGVLEATLADGSGDPLLNQLVTFSTTPELGRFHPETGTALTDENGVAKIDFLAGSDPGAGKATASFGEYSDSVVFQTEGDQAEGMSISLRLTDEATGDETNMISAESPGLLDALVKDKNGDPVSDKVADFSTTLGKLDPEAGKAMTDDNGQASVKLLAGSEPGEGVVTATVDDQSASLTFTTSGGQAEDVQLTLRLLDRETREPAGKISVEAPGILEATLTDKTGNPDADEVIFFSTSPALGRFLPEAATALTDENGVATIDFLAGSKPGNGIATATFNNEYTARTNFETLGDEIMHVSVELTDKETSEPTTTVSADSPGILTATLKDGTRQPVPNQVITFTSEPDLGAFQPDTGTALTDGEGKASVELLAGSKEGDGVITAKFGEYQASLNFYTKGDQPSNLSLTLTDAEKNETETVSADTPGILEAVLKDDYGTPLADKLIVFSTNLGYLVPESGEAVTDSQGMASVQLTAGSKKGEGVARAEYETYSAILEFTSKGDQQPEPSYNNIEFELIDNKTGYPTNSISTDSSGLLVVTLTDEKKAPVPDQDIIFNTTLGSLNKQGSVVSVGTTNNKGQTTAILLAGNIPGDGVATAVFGEYFKNLQFRITDDQTGNVVMNVKLRLVDSGGNGMSSVSADSPGILLATLTDENGVPVPDQEIMFGTSAGNINAEGYFSGTGKTNINGQATATLLAGWTPGSGQATASFGEYSASVGFSTAGDQPKPDIIIELPDGTEIILPE